MSDYLTKRYDVKECATHIVYWVNLKFKVCNLIDASADIHIATHTNVCMSAYWLTDIHEDYLMNTYIRVEKSIENWSVWSKTDQ